MERRVCSGCKQELSRSAFYRHRNPSVCPGRYSSSQTPSSTSIGLQSQIQEVSPPLPHVDTTDTEIPDSAELNSESGDSGDETGATEIPDFAELSSESGNSGDETGTVPALDANEPLNTEMGNEHESLNKDKEPACQSSPILKALCYCLLFFQLKFRIADRGISFLLAFMKGFLSAIVSLVPSSKPIYDLYRKLPLSLCALRKMILANTKHAVTEYVMCPKCSTLYELKDCTTTLPEGSAKCSFIEFPNHPQRNRRNKCNALLMKQVKYGSTQKFIPRKTFWCNSISEGLKSILKRPGMLQMCNKWKENESKSGHLSDITDGKLWKEFKLVNNRPFLDVPNNIALALNIDWFNPYEHTQYSIGAIYFTILNLPRSERYKIENTIIAGLMPGPNEPKRINPFLAPIVDELLQLWKGISICGDGVFSSHTVRAALLCFVSDIPATRKVCGFPGFKATLGCSKCLKPFPCEGFGEPTDYSGFERHGWVARTMKNHLKALGEIKAATTLTEKTRLQKKYGVQYSELSRLPYFDIIRNHVIDPMHNMYLGTAKHMVKVWKESGLLRQEHLTAIQQKLDDMNVPYGVGRIPYKVGSNFIGLTADQWLNWTNVYSLYALDGILPPRDIDCWSLFVEASVLLRQYTISMRDIDRADEKLLEFCRLFERLYGKEKCTPNMHLHTHIKECILDFGPISTFWAFPFERFNGILESFSKNWVKPEEQIMKKIVSFQELIAMQNITPEFSFVPDLCIQGESSGSLRYMQADTHILSCYGENATCELLHVNAARLDIHNVSSRQFEKYFSDSDIENLKYVYSLLYPNSTLPYIPRKHLIFYDLEVLGEHFPSSKSRSQRSVAVMAYWSELSGTGCTVKVGTVDYFFVHTVALCSCSSTTEVCQLPCPKRKEVEHLLAKVSWYSNHLRPSHLPFPLHLVSTVCCADGRYAFTPVSRFLCRCAISPKVSFTFEYGEDFALVVSPYFLTNAGLFKRVCE